MRHKIEEILLPKQAGLINNRKPMVVILGSPWGGSNGPVRFKSARQLLEGNGYRVLNKREMYFNANTLDLKAINGKEKQRITIWFEAHGAPGWLFGKDESLKSELQYMLVFARAIKTLAKTSNCIIENIVLSGCNSATEYLDEKTENYFNSPARLLSFLLPEINVLGFVGRNSSAKITSIWEMCNDELEESVLSLAEGSVLYKDNNVVENCVANLYCPVEEIPKFIRANLHTQEVYFPHVDVQFMLRELGIDSSANSYGQAQFELLIDLQSKADHSEKPSPKFFSPKTRVNSAEENALSVPSIEEALRFDCDSPDEEDGLKSNKLM